MNGSAIDAGTAMWEEFARPLKAFVARRVPVGIEPDDVVQEVFVRVVSRLPTLRDPERAEAWLFQIARNAIRDALRRRRRKDGRNDSLEDDRYPAEPHEDVQSAEAELAPCLSPMIARLSEPYRMAIELTSREQLTQAAAAERLEISVSGMKSRVQRARGQLKRMLLQCCEVAVDGRGGVLDYQLRPSGRSGVFLSESAATSAARMRRMRRATMANSENTSQATTPAASAGCCGGPAPAGADACCVKDAEVKASGGSGCGCGTAKAAPAPRAASCC